jgi:hypothetical protein
MSRVLTFGEALTAIMALTGGIATLVFAVFSLLAGFVRLTGR